MELLKNEGEKKKGKEESLVYTIEQITRICRSTGPKEILIKLAINRHFLLLHISAIKIQSIIRQFLAKVRFRRIQRNVLTFERVTLACADQIVDEVLLNLSLQLVMNTMKSFHQLNHFRTTIDQTIESIMHEIVMDVLPLFMTEIVVDVVQSASEQYIILQRYGSMENYLLVQEALARERLKMSNPLLSVMMTIMEELCHDSMRSIVIQAIEEEVADYLLAHHAIDVYDYLLESHFFENEVISVVKSYLEELSGLKNTATDLMVQLDNRKKQNTIKEVASDTILKSKWTAVRRFVSPDRPEPILKQLTLSQKVAEIFVKNLFSSLLPER